MKTEDLNTPLLLHKALASCSNEITDWITQFLVDVIELYHFSGVGIAIWSVNGYRLEWSKGLIKNEKKPRFILNGSLPVWREEDRYLVYKDIYTALSKIPHASIIIRSKKVLNKGIREQIDSLIESLFPIITIKRNLLDYEDTGRKYQNLFLKSIDDVFIIDNNGRIIEMNESAEKNYGQLSSGSIGFWEMLSDESRGAFKKDIMALHARSDDLLLSYNSDLLSMDELYREVCYTALVRIEPSCGTIKIYSSMDNMPQVLDYTVSLMINRRTCDVNGYVVTLINSSRNEEFRSMLAESEKKYRELFKLMPMFAMLIDTTGKTVEYNDKFMKDYGLEPALAGSSYMDFIYEDDQNHAASLFIDLYTMAIQIKNQWVRQKLMSKDECAKKLSEIGIRDIPIRFVNAAKDHIIETEFSANLWISESDLEIRGALLTAIDVTERNLYRHKVEESEQKYREIVEDKTRDIIFSLDKYGRFITVNRNLREKLGYAEGQVKDQHIVDILYRDPLDKNGIKREIFIENLDRVLVNGETDIRFKAVCDHKFIGEPVVLQFKLDPIFENGRVNGVLGFASELSDDPLREYLFEESLSFKIENKLTLAEEVSFRITRNLQKYFDESIISLLRLGLREIIVNAIEHGNLGITYEEKTVAQKNYTYQNLLRERQNDSKNAKRKVHIEYRLFNDRVVYSIADEGPGFDFTAFIADNDMLHSDLSLEHGRGILIARAIFDKISYNELGNKVSLTAYFSSKEKHNI